MHVPARAFRIAFDDKRLIRPSLIFAHHHQPQAQHEELERIHDH
jgi:hypothetical protein